MIKMKIHNELSLNQKAGRLLFIVWLHVSLLDLFYVNQHGAVFLWQQNSQLLTLFTHAFIAFLTAGFYWLINITGLKDQKSPSLDR